MAGSKERLDIVLVNRGFYPSRERAKAAIMAGLVVVNGERIDKAGTKVLQTADIVLKGEVHPYVSRGGRKLEQALRYFGFDMSEKIVIDIGVSTGGFTDCALQHGAAHVYAVDVGYGQLAWSLRQDPRVTVMERTNFRHLKLSDLSGTRPNTAVMDVSFISIRLLMPIIFDILEPDGVLLTLIKPQFEAGREKVGKHGIVREAQTHKEVLQTILLAAKQNHFTVEGLTFSPITGGDGNIEFLAKLVKQDPPAGDSPETRRLEQQPPTSDDLPEWIDRVVEEAHQALAKKNEEES
ncbi:TlyA family RNA methyltransferase [Fodinisporobacter ferrooxydans]|uniref:TlyA family RNA methyltransferase n=1 Tax=Fodinisporobacter ferrooxydans TaxID=2901836 RepID=A0ABY4CIB2_9BACL|nr:TlyA family RNA methyltransferase [Alicyclobacillaceae bacterium MYW30-H2]